MLKNTPVLFLDQKLMINSPELERSLFLCTTALQARICLEIIKLERIKNFDLIFYTNTPSSTLEFYYKKLNISAKNHIFIHIKNNKDLLKANFFLQPPFLKKNNYNNIYLASIDNLLFKHILKKNKKSNLYTFDDGTANIFKDSEYFKPESIKKLIIYLKIFNLPNKIKIIKKTKKHYTIFNGFNNIVSNEKLKPISIFEKEKNKLVNENITFFIGQPFHEYLNKNQILDLKKYLKRIKIDYYVMHPREAEPILEKITILDKKNEIAEVAIIKIANNKKPLIISAFSTVLFNIDKTIADKIYLSIGNNNEENERIELIKKTGSKIIKIIP